MPSKETAAGQKGPQPEYQLYIMRHGDAVERGEWGGADDAKRPLSPQGRKKVEEIAEGLKRVGFAVDRVVSSPLVRAMETAKIIAESLEFGPPVESTNSLSPGGSAEDLLSFLAIQPNRKRTLLVGHEPDLGELAARLLGAGRHVNLAFKKGGCCMIMFGEFPPKSPGQLVWWLTPRVLRKLA